MGDVLPPKKQAIVERLRRRIEDYRHHHDSCLPRYEIATNGAYDQHKQGTILLQQRFLEPKSKKQNKKSNSEQQHKKEQLGPPNQQKCLKRPSESTSDYEEDHPTKHARIHNNGNPNMTQFSVEIVQQFTSTGSSQSQQIQTNVTVKALSGGNVKDGVNTGSTANSKIQDQNRNTVECKQEPELELDGCLLGSGDPLTNGGSGLPDSLNNFSFMEDSTDEIIHPDTLKDLIAELTPDIMADFNFDKFDKFDDTTDSVKNNEEHEKDLVSSTTSAGLLDVGKNLGATQFSTSQGNVTSSLFDSVTGSGNIPSARLPNYPSLGLDFNMKEPSPAAQTLKQMAEQHQNMQQQQKQMQMGISSPHSRSPFANDFALPPTAQYSNGQPSTDYMGPPSTSGPYMAKSGPGGMFPFSQGNSGLMKQEPNGNVYNMAAGGSINMDMDLCKRQQHAMHMQRLSTVDQKPNIGVPNPQGGPSNRNSLGTPPSVQPTSQPLSFGSTKPLSHFTEPVPTTTVGANQPNSSPVATQSGTTGLMQSQYIQASGMAAGQYPNPPRPQSRPSLQISQTQQMHINQANQQLQVSQGQHIQLQDMSSTQAQQQTMYGFPNQSPADQFQMSISQSQSVNFNQPLISGRGNQPGVVPNLDGSGRMPTPPFDKMDPGLRQKMMQQQMMRQQQMMEKQKLFQQIQQQQQQQHMAFMNRPPPEYKPQQPVVGQQQSMGAQIAGLPNSFNQNVRAMAPNTGPGNTLRGPTAMQQMSNNRLMQSGGGQRQPGAGRFSGPTSATRMPNKVQAGPPPTGFSSGLMRGQRPPNVNVGPEGLNISQRRPSNQEWRQMMMHGQKFGATGMMPPGQNRPPDFGNGSPMMAASYTSMQATSGNMQMSAMQQQQIRMNMAGNNSGRTGAQMLSGSQSMPNMRRGAPNSANMQMPTSSGSLASEQAVGNSTFLPSGGGSMDFNLDLLDNLADGDADLLSSFDSVIPGGASYMLDGGL